ncbi:hypothetical protein CLU79DRAFT_760131, partial [Phycomyces nitens]
MHVFALHVFPLYVCETVCLLSLRVITQVDVNDIACTCLPSMSSLFTSAKPFTLSYYSFFLRSSPSRC